MDALDDITLGMIGATAYGDMSDSTRHLFRTFAKRAITALGDYELRNGDVEFADAIIAIIAEFDSIEP